MRALFLIGTGAFWIAVLAFAVMGNGSHQVSDTKVTIAHQTISLAELAAHATENDCWMAIDGAVYDLTGYVPDHPTKPGIILPWCGKNATEPYRTKNKGRPHSPKANLLLAQYYIGALDEP